MKYVDKYKEDMIFVFGSNLAGIHGAGAALDAHLKYGAKIGVGYGMTGNSFAIPTKGHQLQVLPLKTIEMHVKKFLDFARENKDMKFYITPIGCGLAGYKREQIAPMFEKAPKNCYFAETWLEGNY